MNYGIRPNLWPSESLTVILYLVRMRFINLLFNRNGQINSIKRLNIDFSWTIQQQPDSKLKTYCICMNRMRDDRVPVSVINFAKLGLNCTKIGIGVLVRIRRYWLRLSIGKMTLWYEFLKHGNKISRRKHCNIGCILFGWSFAICFTRGLTNQMTIYYLFFSQIDHETLRNCAFALVFLLRLIRNANYIGYRKSVDQIFGFSVRVLFLGTVWGDLFVSGALEWGAIVSSFIFSRW